MRRRYTDDDYLKMLDLRASGYTCQDIADRMGCGVRTVWEAAGRLDRLERPPPFDIEKMRAMRGRGLSLRNIAMRLGCAPSTVQRYTREVLS